MEIHLLVCGGSQVRSLVWEDSICHMEGWAHVLQPLKLVRLKPVLHNKRSPYTATREIPHTAAKTQ